MENSPIAALSNKAFSKNALQVGAVFIILFAISIHVIRAKLEHKGRELRSRMNGNIFEMKRLKANSKMNNYTLWRRCWQLMQLYVHTQIRN